MKLIGLSGKKHSGKTLAANLLKSMHANVALINFADPLKEEVARACCVSVAEIEREKEVYRKLLQCWGTDFRRSQDNAYWINKMEKRISYLSSNRPELTLVIADVRFRNEAAMIVSMGGSIIRIDRLSASSDDTHISENDLDGYEFDLVIKNDGSVENLVEQLKKIKI